MSPPPPSYRNFSALSVSITACPPGARNGLDWVLCATILPGGGMGRHVTKAPSKTSQNKEKVIP